MTNQVLFRKGQKGSLNAGIMALSKYFIHDGLCSGFPCFNMTIPHREGTPIQHLGSHWAALWVIPWKPSPKHSVLTMIYWLLKYCSNNTKHKSLTHSLNNNKNFDCTINCQTKVLSKITTLDNDITLDYTNSCR